jgi:hypothetical protein
MVAALILGGIGLGVMQLAKQQGNQTIRSRTDADIAQAKAEILALLTNPAHCNANFTGLSPSAAGGDVMTAGVFTLKRCDTTVSANCLSSGQVTKYSLLGTSTWPGSAGGGVTDRVQITRVVRTIPLVTPVSPATKAISNATLEITFSAKQLSGIITTEKMNFTTAVVFNNSGTIAGCPRSWNTTNVYGLP